MSKNFVKDCVYEGLSTARVYEMMKKAKKGKYKYQVVSDLLYGNGGEIYLYKMKNQFDKDWKYDQCLWRNTGGTKIYYKEMNLIRYYFNVKLGPGPDNYSTDYQKQITCDLDYETNNTYVIVHYLGNREAFKPFAHGNSKLDRPFVATKKSTLTTMTQRIAEKRTPQETYADVQQAVRKGFTDPDEFEKHEPSAAPRNLKQAQNIQYQHNIQNKVSYDEVFALYEFWTQEFNDTLLKFDLSPEFIVIFGHPTAVQLGNRLLKENCQDNTLPQLLSYDTTFEVGHFYLSILVMRNTELESDPIFPIMFMLHEKKSTDTHTLMWNIIMRNLWLDKFGENTPLITDRELAIVRAIKYAYPKANHLFCENHIIRDIQLYVKRCKGTKDDIAAYKHHIRLLYDSKSEEEFDELLEEFKLKWSQPFIEYFDKNLKNHLKTNCCFFNTSRFAAFSNNKSPTNNISESINALIKKHTRWTELPVDAIFLALYQMQNFILSEFSRGYRNLGKYRPKNVYNSSQLKLDGVVIDSIDTIIQRIKQNSLSLKQHIKIKPTYRMSQTNIANLCVENDLIGFDAHNHIFTVISPFKDKAFAVKLMKNKLICQCLSAGLCYHVLAVSVFLSSEKYPDQTTYKLSELIKKRYNEPKGGRKAPRTRDITVIAAPDSTEEFIKSRERDSDSSSSDSSDTIIEMFDEEDILCSTPVPEHIEVSGHRTPKKKTTPFRQNDYVKQQYVPRNIHNITISCDANDMVDIRNLPLVFTEKSFAGSSTVERLEWFNDDVMNLIIPFIINHYKRSDILFVETWHYSLVSTHQSENYISFCDRYQAFNKDYLIVALNNEIFAGMHWMLGLISFKLREIILLDSLNNSHREEQFDVLRRMAMMAAATAKIKLNLDTWNYIYADDIPKQNNGYDCGLFVILYAYAFVRNEKFFSLPSDIGIRWIKYLGSSFSFEPQKRLYPRMSPKDLLDVRNIISQQSTMLGSPINIEMNMVEEKLLQTIDDSRNETNVCDFSFCRRGSEVSSTLVMCIICRKWFHEACQPYNSNVKYYKCFLCSELDEY
ncbi:uncharacterized protein B4U80_13156 [Leptotrombidium deliense]|uniref:SWIM-type domain-containing protein n=1 Tax=Leptotrombidium deliense TaxID=299467 RepID=A0A443SBI7_9ACAR|nr:uncharacterized protein B4U80_13156 [Leptotrombidium deliense]